ncbi:MAG: NAD(P)-dependent oxidoreductase [Bacteroidetes bacterium RIFCSPLOWO2_12_FULL_35_15]|nr:MAG: NAD(P)-dependent oxidoreductase [Bacteroidetes bacterium RIFCSPLOWO2_12_FULL_35_15]
MKKFSSKQKVKIEQSQAPPGKEYKMIPTPVFDDKKIKGSGKLKNKVAFITGGDSGIGKATAILFAKEGATIVIVYLNEHKDAKDTKKIIEEEYGQNCLLISGDIGKEKFCLQAISETIKKYKKIDILVNNAGIQYEQKKLGAISSKQLQKTFETNLYAQFWLSREALKYIPKGGAIINTTSITAYRGSYHLMDYAATKGAIVSFTRSLSANLADKGIRVNAVAPGPIWTPLIVSSFDPKKVSEFGKNTPMKRAGQPLEVATCFLFLACDDSSYMTGQVLHPNGGEIING